MQRIHVCQLKLHKAVHLQSHAKVLRQSSARHTDTHAVAESSAAVLAQIRARTPPPSHLLDGGRVGAPQQRLDDVNCNFAQVAEARQACGLAHVSDAAQLIVDGIYLQWACASTTAGECRRGSGGRGSESDTGAVRSTHEFAA